jgi:hypothetical protein
MDLLNFEAIKQKYKIVNYFVNVGNFFQSIWV